MVQAIPDGYSTVTPYLVARDADGLLAFMKEIGATERGPVMRDPEGKIGHGEVQIGDSVIMLGEAPDDASITKTLLHLYVQDCDSIYDKAVAAGGETVKEPADQFYGDRSATVRDKWGNMWSFATHVEDVSREEMERRMKEVYSS